MYDKMQPDIGLYFILLHFIELDAAFYYEIVEFNVNITVYDDIYINRKVFDGNFGQNMENGNENNSVITHTIPRIYSNHVLKIHSLSTTSFTIFGSSFWRAPLAKTRQQHQQQQ